MLLARSLSVNIAIALLGTLSVAIETFNYNSSSATEAYALPAGVSHETTKLNGFNIRKSR
jgi:hypothetical protein